MIDAEQWLADLEAKAAEASLAEKQGLVCGWWDIAEFREMVTPATVLRLVGMVRILRDQLETLQQSPRMNCYFGSVLEKAYAATEERHD